MCETFWIFFSKASSSLYSRMTGKHRRETVWKANEKSPPFLEGSGVSFFRRGQYSDAVLSELENQNDSQIEGMSARVKMLKDVSLSLFIYPLYLFQ